MNKRKFDSINSIANHNNSSIGGENGKPESPRGLNVKPHTMHSHNQYPLPNSKRASGALSASRLNGSRTPVSGYRAKHPRSVAKYNHLHQTGSKTPTHQTTHNELSPERNEAMQENLKAIEEISNDFMRRALANDAQNQK